MSGATTTLRKAASQSPRRSFSILNEKNAAILRLALVNFVMGAAIRRIQQQKEGQPTRKYSFLFHTEQAWKSHDWQEQVVTAIRDQLVEAAKRKTIPDWMGFSRSPLTISSGPSRWVAEIYLILRPARQPFAKS
jgi:hypothetical protein